MEIDSYFKGRFELEDINISNMNGALLFSNSNVTLKNFELSNSTITEAPSIIQLDSTEMYITDSYFNDIYVAVISLTSSGYCNIKSSTFNNVEAAIFLEFGRIELSTSIFQNIHSSLFEAMYISNCPSFKMDHCVFRNCSSNNAGGALFIDGQTNFDIQNCIVSY